MHGVHVYTWRGYVCMCVHACAQYVPVHVHSMHRVHVYVCIYVDVCIYVYVCIRMCVCACTTCVCLCMRVHAHVHVCVRTQVLAAHRGLPQPRAGRHRGGQPVLLVAGDAGGRGHL